MRTHKLAKKLIELLASLFSLYRLGGRKKREKEATMRKACSVPLILVLLAFLSCLFLVHAAAVSGGNRRALLPREAAAVVSGGQALPTTVEEAAVGGEVPLLADEETVRRVDLQTEDYPGSGANSRHDPRNPH